MAGNAILQACKREFVASSIECLFSLVITLLFATVSGKAEQLALLARDRLLIDGWMAEVHNLATFPAVRLNETQIALIITSSWGDGAPPPDALEFFHAIETPKLRLPQLTYAVLALGVHSNRLYVGSGWRIDTALEARGARRLLPRRECDRNEPQAFDRWLDTLVEVLPDENSLMLPELRLA